MNQLILLRHGQTAWNLEGRWQGHADPPLNSNGLEQAHQAADELKATHLSAIYSSDLQRARVTAEAIASFHNLPVKIDPRLRELNMGVWEGELVLDIPRLYPVAWADRQARPVDASPPGGESVGQLAERVKRGIDAICLEHPQEPILIVSHGLALAAFLCLAQTRPLEEAFKSIPPNARPVYLDYQPLGLCL